MGAIWEPFGSHLGAIWGPWGAPSGALGGPGGRGVLRGGGRPPPESLRGCLPRKKPLKTNGNIKILKNEEKNSIVFLNLLRPRKLVSRLHEKQILRKLSKNKWYLFEICNFGKWSFRVCKSKIFMKKYKHFTKTHMFPRCRFLRDVCPKMKIFKKIIVEKVHFSSPKRGVKRGSKSACFLSDFSGSFF